MDIACFIKSQFSKCDEDFFLFKGCLMLTYKTLCERLLLPALEMDEIHEALSLLESQSILKQKSSSYQLLVDKTLAGKMIADSSLISQINAVRLDKQ